MKMKSEKTDRKKEEVAKRADLLDPNNNKDLPQRTVVKRRGKKVHDDGFEHRASSETV
jgi:hypothetical protein